MLVACGAFVSLPAAAAGDGLSTGSMAGLVVVCFLIVLALLLRGWRGRRGLVVVLTALGGGVGSGIGLSQEPVIGTVVPLLVALLGVGLMAVPSISAEVRSARTRGIAGFCLMLQLTALLGCCLRIGKVWYTAFATLAAMGALFAGVLGVALAARWYWTRFAGDATRGATDIDDRTWLLVAAAAAGAFAGIATSMSKAPIVDYVVPALLSLFGLLSVFLFSEAKAVRAWLGSALVGFGLLLVLGQYLGEILRGGYRWSDAGETAFSISVLYVVIAGAAALLGGVAEDRVNSVGFAACGAGTGLAVGFSASPILSAIVPAVLTAAGGVAAYFGVARQKGERLLYVFAGTFALLLLVGGYAGWTLHNAHPEVKTAPSGLEGGSSLREKVEAVQDEVGRLREVIRATGVPAAAASTLQRIDEGITSVLSSMASVPTTANDNGRVNESLAYLWFEGAAQCSAIAITCTRALTAPLRVDELVDEVCLFSGTLASGMGVCLFGEALEISWRRGDGQDAVSVLVWDKMTRTSNGWRVEGKGVPVDGSTAEIRGDRYVLSIL